MRTSYIDDIIAAVSTAVGPGGIGIVRISGEGSVALADKIFKSASGVKLRDKKTHTITYGNVVNNEGSIVDEALVSIMLGPNSYTKEDIVEINCHGGFSAVKKVLETVVNAGARPAEPGEFTKRAFLNGRIDLSQAEAVIDIINSKTELSMKNAVGQLEGVLGNKIKDIRSLLIDAVSTIEAAIDYPEHDIEEETYAVLSQKTRFALREVEKLIKTADTGIMLKDGVNMVILGRPNVGKSSLLNFMLNEERAIVTDIPGTTRDTVEEYFNISGIPVKIADTAGVRQTDDIVEKIGVERSVERAKNADLIILMLDMSRPLSDDDIKLLDFIRNKKYIIALNKCDLSKKADISNLYKDIPNENIVEVSVKENTGMDSLMSRINDILTDGSVEAGDGVMVSSARHKNLLLNAAESLKKALNTIESGMPEDFVSMDITDALGYLGEITGENVKEDILNRIFERFCVGK